MHIIPEWLELVSLAFCLGAIVCRLWIFTPAAENEYSPKVSYARGMWVAFYVGIAILIVGGIFELLVRTSEIIGQPFPAFFPVVPTVLSKTLYGHVWIIRISAVLLLALTRIVARDRDSVPVLIVMLLLALVVSATASASGHASDAGDLSVPEVMDWLHLIAACLWGGGLITLSISILPNLIAGGEGAALVTAQTAGRFSMMAGICVGLMSVSALYNLWYYVRFVDALPNTPYGLAVTVKIVLFIILLCLGAFNRYIGVPLLQERAGIPPQEGSMPERIFCALFSRIGRMPEVGAASQGFRRRVGIETALIVVVLLCAAVLRHEIPARHAAHREHIREDGPYHKMDGNHDPHDHVNHSDPPGRP